jgi:hypothetical protein
MGGERLGSKDDKHNGYESCVMVSSRDMVATTWWEMAGSTGTSEAGHNRSSSC